MIESLSDEAEPELDHSPSELTEDSSLEALEEIEEVIEQELEDEAGAEYEDAEYEDAEYEDAEEDAEVDASFSNSFILFLINASNCLNSYAV